MNRISAAAAALLLPMGMATAQVATPILRIGEPQQPAVAPKNIGHPNGSLTGERRGLVVLLAYNDLDFSTDDPKTDFDRLLNEEGFSDNGAPGSVHDYFLSQSGGQFSVTFDVVGPFRLSKSVTYYGANVGANGRDDQQRIHEMVVEALHGVDDEVDFSTYDWNGDGEAEHVQFVYAGYGEASGAPDYTIWPMESVLGDDSLRLDNVCINTFSCSSELYGNSGHELAGLGTFCHEFSHCLGLPDMYDTSGSTASFGMGYWDVMSHGNYNGNGWTPSAFTSYERMFCGWLQPIELKEPCRVEKMKPLVSGGEAYIIRNPANANEYYLLENRYQTSWDGGQRGSGLLIIHVNYNETAWEYNRVNASAFGQQGCTIFHADNSDGLSTLADLAGDVYPYTSYSPYKLCNELTDTSVPAATLATANTDGTFLMHCAITDIKRTGRNISFTFNGGADLSGVEAVGNAPAALDNTVYDLSGRRIAGSQLKKGIYVIGGKKVAVK